MDNIGFGELAGILLIGFVKLVSLGAFIYFIIHLYHKRNDPKRKT